MPGQRKFETILTADGLVSEEQLKQVVRYAQSVGIDLYEAVLQKKIAPPDAVMMAYAESVGLPFLRLADVTIDEEIVAQLEPVSARQYSVVPLATDQGYVQLAVTKPVLPDTADKLRMIFNMPVRCVICSPVDLSEAIAKYYPRGTVRTVMPAPAEAPIARPKPKPPAKPTEPLSPEAAKDRLMKTIITFNFGAAFVFFALQNLPVLGDSFVVLITLSLCVGAASAFAVWRLLSR